MEKTAPEEVLTRLRTFCLSLPETSEKASWGHPNFLAGRRPFAVFEYYEGRPCIAFKIDKEEQQNPVDDGLYFLTPYIGRYGWRSIWVDEPLDWDSLRNYIINSYRLTALKRMLKALDDG